MVNPLLERVESLLDRSENRYVVTLQIAFLAKRKKSIEDFSSTSSKENIIVQSVNDIFEGGVNQGE